MTHNHLNTVSPAAHSLRAQGFTLIELMITVVIAAILVSVALPLYQRQMRESRRTDARSALSDLASREERYYAINNVYTSSATSLGYTAWPQTVGSGYYQIAQPAITAATATAPASFSLTATPIAGKGQDQDTDCTSFTVASTGQTSATGNSPTSCWGQ